MKRIALLLIIGFLAFGMYAQDCAKKCAVKTSTTSIEKNMEKGVAQIANVAQIAEVAKAKPACCSAKMADARPETKVGSVKMVAEEIAAQDEAIEKIINEESGNVVFVRNYICPETNKEVSVEVTFDEETQKFVDMKDCKPGTCGPDCKKACCASGACKDKAKACCATKKTE